MLLLRHKCKQGETVPIYLFIYLSFFLFSLTSPAPNYNLLATTNKQIEKKKLNKTELTCVTSEYSCTESVQVLHCTGIFFCIVTFKFSLSVKIFDDCEENPQIKKYIFLKKSYVFLFPVVFSQMMNNLWKHLIWLFVPFFMVKLDLQLFITLRGGDNKNIFIFFLHFSSTKTCI